MALNYSDVKNLKDLLWFNRFFTLVAFIGMLVGVYFTKGTVWVVFPLIIGMPVMFILMFNNSMIGDFVRKIS